MQPSANKPTRKNQKIRLKNCQELPRFIREGECISRHQALNQIRRHVDAFPLHPEALRLIELFQLAPEELSEAGLPYESLKALELHALFI